MSFSFSQPWLLLGLVATTLPLLVHLLFRPKPRPLPFGPMAFVLKSLQHAASLWRLRRWLVYLLRTLLLLALALAFARPWLAQNTSAAAALQGEAATALVLDASFSMRYALGKHTAFEVAKTQALKTLEALLETEPATVVLCDGVQRPPPPPPSLDKAFWRRYLQEARPSFLPSTLNSCMETAMQLLQESPLQAKRLVVLSDFARHALHMSVAPPHVRGADAEARLPWVVLHPVYEGKEAPQNRALLSLEAQSAEGEAGLFHFVAAVHNFGPKPQKDVELQLRVGGQVVAKAFVELPAHGSARKTLSAQLAPHASYEVEARLAADGLPEDDGQTLWLRLHRAQRLLLVDGAPAADRQASKAYFVELALGQLGQARLALRDSQAAWREALHPYTAVFLLNVAPPPPEAVAALKAFVHAGGGLWLSLGNNVQTPAQLEAWNQALGELLPRPLRWVKETAGPAATPKAPGATTRIAHVENAHPLLQPFKGEGLEGLLSARFFRHALLEARAPNPQPLEVLLRLEDGAPLLVAHSLGKGRILTFVSSADREWNDLPLRTAFVPLLQRSAQWLSGSLLNEEVPTALLGQSLRLAAPQPVYVGPHGEALRAEPEGAEFVRLGPLNAPGLWWPQGRTQEAMPLLVKPLPQESDLALLDMAEVRAWFGNPHMAEGGSQRQRPLWSALLLLGALALCAEMWLSTDKNARGQKTRRQASTQERVHP